MSGPRALVAGAGAYGWTIAGRLAELGAAVTVIDPRPVDDEWRASGGLTRVLRLEYGTKAVYSELTLRARDRWRAIERETGADLYREVGVLFLVPEGDGGDWERASLAVTGELGAAGTELTAAQIARRWPIRADGIAWGVHNPVGGFLWAHRATGVLAELARAAGVAYLADHVVGIDGGGATLAGGGRIDADLVVVATGSWTGALVGEADVTPTRQVTVNLRGTPAGLPVFGEGAPFAMYGIPGADGWGLKLGAHVVVDGGDPDDPAQRVATDADVRPFVDFAARRFGLTGPAAEVVRADVCFYAMTPTEDPVIARLDDGLVVCAGFSGHGFKYAPVLGPAVAEWAMGMEPSARWDAGAAQGAARPGGPGAAR